MQTSYEIIQPDGTRIVRNADLPHEPHIDQLYELIRPALNQAWPERVRVLVGEQYLDMFVDEQSLLKGLEFNEAATEIYRNNALTHDPEAEASALPFICGTAVLFSRPVWF